MPCEEVDRLFLTHLHFDHIVDVPYLVFVGWVKVRAKPLRIYGPVGTKHFVSHVIRPPFEQDIQSRIGHGKDDGALDPEVIEIADKGEFFAADDFRLSATFTDHGNIPTLAYRVDTRDRRVVIAGDGTPDANFPAFCRDADLLSVECSGTAEFLATQPWGSWHITPQEIAAIATEAPRQMRADQASGNRRYHRRFRSPRTEWASRSERDSLARSSWAKTGWPSRWDERGKTI